MRDTDFYKCNKNLRNIFLKNNGGYQDKADLMSYVELFDVGCLLSRWEGFGLALPEYMMAGKPIVATSVDAIPNIIKDGENGLLVNVDDYQMACDKVLKIWEDEKLKKMLIDNGIHTVNSRFDARRMGKEHEEMFSREMGHVI